MRIDVKELTVIINEKPVLDNITLSLDEGIHVVLGPNGAGKSTLLKSIACLLRPFKGEILLDGVNLCELPRAEISKRVGYCWQNPLYGFFESTVEREIYFIIKNLRIPPRKDILKILGVEKFMKRSPFELSGGEAKRVSLASILIANQPIILLDEPFEELDWSGYKALQDLLRIFRDEGKIVIIATNNPLEVEPFKPDTFVLISSGKIKSKGPWSELNDDLLKESGVIPRGYICRFC